ncbi:MAG TPA: type I-E CRISPR-associated protein Cse2/CasB [Spirochaetota bacterium]|nr:type I-E CRISPR-associated protein Cse2/CasB [Spirochaetota bacterium]HPI90724.1 type I-E CRISPR-associated protein Cse2/CasB [Spirochaetota bacterium]HPR49745.1 type I-E CRISPR-associated protein Cse2/CasB [Spirochaetota bacterium]
MEKVAEKKSGYKKISEKEEKALFEWWHWLHGHNGQRAGLRRCSSFAQVSLHPETFLIKHIIPHISHEAAAVTAGILSHIDRDDNKNLNKKFIETLARSHRTGRPPFSETRFRHLISAHNWDELYSELLRAVKLLKGKTNPVAVADVILRWDDEFRSINNRNGLAAGLRFELSEEYFSLVIKNN